MTDVTLNRYLSSGTAAERAAFTPDPPVPESGPDFTYFWLETDTGKAYAWDYGAAVWVLIANPGGGIDQLTGDVTAGPGSGSQVATLANTAVTPGVYGDTTHVGQFTVDSKGRLVAASNVAISGGGGGSYAPLTTGAEPVALVSNGAGALIMVAYTP